MRGTEYTLRSREGDFCVEEIIDLRRKEEGAYSIYRLSKKNLDTFAALRIVSKRTGIPLKLIGYAGLKDRYTSSIQYISIQGKAGKALDFSEKSISLSFVCRSDTPIRLGSHKGNRFRIVLRKMEKTTLLKFKSNLETLGTLPAPNYFDSQRFGSIRGSREFFAISLLKGEYERGLKLILTSRYRKERSYIKAIKKYLEENWGKWSECASYLENQRKYENYLQIFTYLKEQSDFKGALKLVRQQILKIGFSALQSYIWNESLKNYLVSCLGKESLSPVKYEAGELYFLKADQKRLAIYEAFFKERVHATLPIPHYKKSDDKNIPLIQETARNFGIELPKLRKLEDFGVSLLRGKRKMFFRTNVVLAGEGKEDGKYFAELSFTLPRGAYATVVIKSLFV